jgi:Rrf2 family protein
MNLTSKSRYALKIMMDLTHFRSEPLIRRSDIASRQGVPSDYLDQIMMRLRSSGLVDSVRGRSGGYRLGKDPAGITLWDVFSAVEDMIYPTECVSTNHACDFESGCIAKSAWSEIFDAIKSPLMRMNLADIADRWADEHLMCPVGGIRECRPGKSPEKVIEKTLNASVNSAGPQAAH